MWFFGADLVGVKLSAGKCLGEIAETLPSNADDSAKEGAVIDADIGRLEEGEFCLKILFFLMSWYMEIIHVCYRFCYLCLVDFMIHVDQFAYGLYIKKGLGLGPRCAHIQACPKKLIII